MRIADRRRVREEYQRRCGYCGILEDEAGAELTIDHFQPQSQGGTDDLENLVYCCHACNEFKGDYWEPDSEERILHPRLDSLSEHLREYPDGTVMGLTPTGVFHVQKMRLNRPQLIARRLARQREIDRDERLARLEARGDVLHETQNDHQTYIEEQTSRDHH
jgi:hypothetical protein